jgi:hypothetical protein
MAQLFSTDMVHKPFQLPDVSDPMLTRRQRKTLTGAEGTDSSSISIFRQHFTPFFVIYMQEIKVGP